MKRLCREGDTPLARTFGMETREDTIQFRRRTSFSGTIGRSPVNRPPPRRTVLILAGESPIGLLREVIRPGVGFSPGIATHCPRPRGAGEEAGGRAGWVFRGTAACGEGARPLPCPHPPGRRVTTVHCPGEQGEQSSSSTGHRNSVFQAIDGGLSEV